MNPKFEKDNSVSGFLLESEGTDLSLSYYLHALFSEGPGEFQLINIESEIQAYLLIFTDGEQLCRLVIGEGISHIPLKVSYQEYVNVYVRPHESVEGEHELFEVHFDLI